MSGATLATAVDAFVELNDLKRITSAGRIGSIATRLFRDAWSALVSGGRIDAVAGWITGRALAAARLGDIDRSMLAAAGVPDRDARAILVDAIETVGSTMSPAVRSLVESNVAWDPALDIACPAFVAALSEQPRAGITCPGKARILLEPPENHAEHCLMVAVYGVLLADHYGADPGRVFLAALAHHFHNAGMPDSGFTGEMLLGLHLETLMTHHTTACLQQLPPALRDLTGTARAILPDAETADGRAFHAADVLDRVLQLNQYMRAAALTPDRMLGEMELVHAGPVKAFQDAVLRRAGLL